VSRPRGGRRAKTQPGNRSRETDESWSRAAASAGGREAAAR